MLKLGTVTNSVVNHLYSRMTHGQPEPTVGLGATLLGWTDRYPATITEVTSTLNGSWLITVQRDNYKRVDNNGLSESQEYVFTPDPNGASYLYRFDGEKGWRMVRRNAKGRLVLAGDGGGWGLRIGQRDKYHDFSF